jgi:hypothetical protein
MTGYGSNKLFKALHDWREMCRVVAGVGNSAVREFCFWLDENGYRLYNAKTEGVFDLQTEAIIKKSAPSPDPEKEYLKDLLMSFALRVDQARYYENCMESEEFRKIMAYTCKDRPDEMGHDSAL